MHYLWYIATVIFIALSYLDITQTIELQKLGAVENNRLLGPHPSKRKIIWFGIVSSLLWWGFALFLAYKGAPKIEFVACGMLGLRLKTVLDSRKLQKELEA